MNFWSEGFQKLKEPLPSLTISPGDQVSLVCKYDTSKIPSTIFGLKTENEMCVGMLFYYPAQVDPRTGHEMNLCGYAQLDNVTDTGITLCGDNARSREFFSKDFPLGRMPSPKFNDSAGAPTNFGQEKTCPTTTPIPTKDASSDTPTESVGSDGGTEFASTPSPTNAQLTPSPGTEASDDSACFPAHANVRTRDGSTVEMRNLRVGDVVAVGPGKFSEVFAFSHADDSRIFNFVRLLCGNNTSLVLPAGHYVPVGVNGKIRTASDIRVGDHVTLGSGTLAVVSEIDVVSQKGLYNPQTMDGHIVVNGVVVSTFTETVPVEMATALLTPLRWAFAIFGVDASAILI